MHTKKKLDGSSVEKFCARQAKKKVSGEFSLVHCKHQSGFAL